MNVFCTNTFSIENALCLCFTLLYAILLQLLQLALKPSLLEKPVNPFLSVISSSRSDFATRPFYFHKVRIIQVDFLYVSAILSKVKTPSYFILIMLLFLPRHLYKSCIIQHVRAHRSFPRTLGLVTWYVCITKILVQRKF